MHIPYSALKIGSLRLSGFRHFSEEFDRNLSDSSVRSFCSRHDVSKCILNENSCASLGRCITASSIDPDLKNYRRKSDGKN